MSTMGLYYPWKTSDYGSGRTLPTSSRRALRRSLNFSSQFMIRSNTCQESDDVETSDVTLTSKTSTYLTSLPSKSTSSSSSSSYPVHGSLTDLTTKTGLHLVRPTYDESDEKVMESKRVSERNKTSGKTSEGNKTSGNDVYKIADVADDVDEIVQRSLATLAKVLSIDKAEKESTKDMDTSKEKTDQKCARSKKEQKIAYTKTAAENQADQHRTRRKEKKEPSKKCNSQSAVESVNRETSSGGGDKKSSFMSRFMRKRKEERAFASQKEWRKYLEKSMLIEMAVQDIVCAGRGRKTLMDPYARNTPTPTEYSYPEDTVLVSGPRTPVGRPVGRSEWKVRDYRSHLNNERMRNVASGIQSINNNNNNNNNNNSNLSSRSEIDEINERLETWPMTMKSDANDDFRADKRKSLFLSALF